MGQRKGLLHSERRTETKHMQREKLEEEIASEITSEITSETASEKQEGPRRSKRLRLRRFFSRVLRKVS